MKFALYTIILFTHGLALSQSMLEKDSLVLFTRSLGDFVSENAHKIVSENWPFTIESKAGDLIDNIIIEEIDRNNEKIWGYLDSKGFKCPEVKYYSEVENERIKIKRVLNLVDNFPKIIKLHKKLKRRKRMSSTQLIKIDNMSYVFSIFSFDVSEIEKPEKLEIEVIANIESNKVTVIRN